MTVWSREGVVVVVPKFGQSLSAVEVQRMSLSLLVAELVGVGVGVDVLLGDVADGLANGGVVFPVV